MKISWCGTSVSGYRKEQNDDSWIAFSTNLHETIRLPESGLAYLETEDLIFAVSDGMGGGNAGYLASELILKKLSETIPKVLKSAASGLYPDITSHLDELVSDIHKQINDTASASEENQGMAATLALTWFTPENMYLVNVGDTRIYRGRAGKLEQISKDHSFVWAQWKRNEIHEIEYRNHPRRFALYEIIGGNHTLVHPHMKVVPYQIGDRFLIASDGLIDGLSERQIENLMNESSSASETCLRLTKSAVSHAGKDDTTVLILDIVNSDSIQSLL